MQAKDDIIDLRFNYLSMEIGGIMKCKIVVAIIALIICIMPIMVLADDEVNKTYDNEKTTTKDDITLHVQYDNPVIGQPITFHLSVTGGSETSKFYMSSVSYNDNQGDYEAMINDHVPGYTDFVAYKDYEFTPMASGTYGFRFCTMYRKSDDGPYYILNCDVSVAVEDSNYPTVTNKINQVTKECKSKTDGSEYEMALWLHDWLTDQITYDYSLYWCSVESGLCRGKGTCESYQRIYSKLLDAVGISNGRLTGNGHTWNAVKIDGKWCQIDPTWDDDSSVNIGVDMSHYYFGITDEAMAEVHSDLKSKYIASGYEYRSSDMSNSYYVRNGEAKTWAKSYIDRIQEQIDNGNNSFSIATDNSNWGMSYIQYIYNANVAYELEQMSWNGIKDGNLHVTAGDNTLNFTLDDNTDQTSETTEPTTASTTTETKNVVTTKANNIIVKGTSFNKLKSYKRAFKAYWSRGKSPISGYQLRYSTKKSMKQAKTKRISGIKYSSKKVTKLSKKTRYYVQVRTYQKKNGKTYYSKWSNTKTIKTR